MAEVTYADLWTKGAVWRNGSPFLFAWNKALAHEFGHALSLPHVATQGNLMIDGKLRKGGGVGPGSKLTAKQILAARRQAFTGGPFVPGLNPRPAKPNQPKPPGD